MKKRLAVLLLLFAVSTSGAGAQSDLTSQEDAIGRQVYSELSQKGEILHSSPYYAVLAPIAARIRAVADPQYERPFTFVLVHETAPNAFAVPGGNVYVTDSLMRFVENREELAGVLCHETSHDIHHDVVNNLARAQRARTGTALLATAATMMLGGRGSTLINGVAQYGLLAQVQNFSREVETAADLKGAQTCAQAGFNPWGMVWLFQRFEKSSTGGQMEMLSDHPTDDHRIEDLQRSFAADPSLFARYSPSVRSATPLGR